MQSLNVIRSARRTRSTAEGISNLCEVLSQIEERLNRAEMGDALELLERAKHHCAQTRDDWSFSEPVRRLMADYQARIFETIAVLELLSTEATSEGTDSVLMGAVGGALRLLRPIHTLTDSIALRKAAASVCRE